MHGGARTRYLRYPVVHRGELKLPKKPNYNFEKNRKEQERKKKKEEKRLRKLENAADRSAEPSMFNEDGSPAPPRD